MIVNMRIVWLLPMVAAALTACCPADSEATDEKQGKDMSMQERTGLITFKGEGLTLLGPELNVGDDAPDVTLVNTDLEAVALGSFKNKIVVLSVVPSLDTEVCSLQTKRFNQEATSLSDGVEIVTVSMDLPFAQKRWCGAEGVDRLTMLSDYKTHEFGQAYGVRIKELGLLARSVFVVNPAGDIRYIQLVKEVTDEPDYAEVIAAIKALSE